MSTSLDNLKETYDSSVLEAFKDDIISKKLILLGNDENIVEHNICYTKIKKYTDKRNKLNTSIDSIEDTVKAIEQYSNDKNNKILEITDSRKQYFRLFFDLEGTFDENLLLEFIEDFKKFVLEEYHMKCTEYYTKNHKSVHGEASYHVFFNIYTMLDLMAFVINSFHIYTNRKYQKIIDRCVYRHGRLFRSPYALRPTQKSIVAGDGRDEENENDFHMIIKGTIEDCLISNIKNCYKIIPSYITLVSPTFSYYNHSIDVEIEDEEDKKKYDVQIKSLKEIKEQLEEFAKLIL